MTSLAYARTASPKTVQQGISYLLWIAYTCPLANLRKHIGSIICATDYLPCFSEGILELNAQFRIAANRFVQAPAWVRCMHCGKLRPNSLSQASVFITQCPDCELRSKGIDYELGLRMASSLQVWLRTHGLENLTREQMLSFNAQANAICPHLPTCTAHARTDGMAMSMLDSKQLQDSYAVLSAAIAKLKEKLVGQPSAEQVLAMCLNKPNTNPTGRTHAPVAQATVTLEDM